MLSGSVDQDFFTFRFQLNFEIFHSVFSKSSAAVALCRAQGESRPCGSKSVPLLHGSQAAL